VLHSVHAGNDTFESVVADIRVHPRIVAECLSVLFESGILEFRADGGLFSVTTLGQQALTDTQFIPATLHSLRRSYLIVVERLTGLAETSSQVTFERSDQLRAKGVTVLPPSNVDPTPGRSAIRRLVEKTLRPGEWVRSVGHPSPVNRYNAGVEIDIHSGRIERLRSTEWARRLAPVLIDRGFELAEPAIGEPASPWISIPLAAVRAVSGPREHAVLIERAFSEASSYVLIHSAFLSGARVRELGGMIREALRRGVDVILARGGTEDASTRDDEGVQLLQSLAAENRSARGRFFFESFPTRSHAKILIWDGNFACVGSFNWLSAGAASKRQEFSLLVESADLSSKLSDFAADFCREDEAAWPSQLLRARGGVSLESSSQEGLCSARLVVDMENRDAVFGYLDEANDSVFIAADRVSPKPDPFLHLRLSQAAQKLASCSGLSLRVCELESENPPVFEGLEKAGATIKIDGVNHAKVIVMDSASALVTSFNLLSFGGHSKSRSSGYELGLEIRAGSGSGSFIRDLFKPLFP
jgi:hypothetical protein